MYKAIWFVFVLLNLIQVSCHRPDNDSSVLKVNWQNPSRQSVQGPYLTQISGTSSFGAKAVETLSQIDCIAILISDGTGSDSCKMKNGQSFSISSLSGFAAPEAGLSIEVESGLGRTIRVLAVDRLESSECPSLITMDRLSISSPRVIFQATRDLVPGDNNISIVPDLTGSEVVSCQGPNISQKSNLCNRTFGSTDPFILVHLSNGQAVVDFESKFSDLGMTRSGSWTAVNSHHYSLAGGMTAAAVAQRLCESSMVQFVEPSQDPAVIRFHETTYDRSSVTNATPVVAVLSTGSNLGHEATVGFTDSLWLNPLESGADEDGNSFPNDTLGWDFFDDDDTIEDIDGQGSGLMGVVLNTSVDITGTGLISPISVMTVKIMDDSGLTDFSKIASGILYSVQNNADVALLPVAGDHSELVRRALTFASNKGVLLVAPAGNTSSDNDINPIFPSSYNVNNLVSVAALSAGTLISGFSNYGLNSVDIAAAGTTVLTIDTSLGFVNMSGTSFAAANVAGVSALMKVSAPQLSGYQLKQALFNSTSSLPQWIGKVSTSGTLSVGAFSSEIANRIADPYLQPIE